MSRCFPFPPPGYEKKERSGQEDLLEKEKHNEKRHKKEKDKEKKEGKEKKEKDKSKDKHKEKKDRKEKRKEKKKDKDKDKDKSKTLADRTDKQSDSHHEGSLGESSRKTEEINHSKLTVELARRIKDEEKVKASRMVENFNGSVQRSTNGLDSATIRVRERVADGHDIPSPIGALQKTVEMGRQYDNLTTSTRKVESLGSANVLQKERSSSELEQKFKIAGQRGTGGLAPAGKPVGSIQGRFDVPSSTAVETEKYKSNQVVSNPSNAAQKTINGMHRPVEKLSGLGHTEGFNAISLSTKMEDREVNKISTNHIIAGQRKVDGMVRSVENASEKSIDGKERKKDKDSDSKKEKHRDKNRDEKKKKKKKDKDKLKEKEKEKTKIREEGEHKHKKYDEPRDGGKKDHIGSSNLKPLTLQSVDTSYLTDENGKKRKEIKINGLSHENNLRHNKIPRTTPPHLLVENGRTLELPHIASASSSMKSGTMNNIIPGQKPLDVNERMDNGITKSGLRHPVSIDIDGAGKVSLRPFHPDVKYLSQIYDVPKMDEWPEYNDQEWLFSSSKLRQKPDLQLGVDEKPQVWAEALRIELEDVLALPYVIPF